jgi:hypothetical protein
MQLFPINWCWGRKVSKNKALELQVALDGDFSDWFKFCLETRSKQDHAGLYFTLELATCFYFHIWLYDVRHWNWEKGRFYYDHESEIG